MENIFIKAIRDGVRFNYKGQLSCEDMWQLKVVELDNIFKSINKQLKQASEESLLGVKSKEDKELEMKLEIVKYIVKTKLEEAEIAKNAKIKKDRNQEIMNMISIKKNEELSNKTVEELQAML